MSSLNNYNEFISFYSKDIVGTGYLAFRDLPCILKNLSGKFLDFGCGAGRSTSYLTRLGLEVIGVDIDKKMIQQATLVSKNAQFYTLSSKNLPFKEGYFSHIFNSFVLFDFSSQQEITDIFSEFKRVCKKNGSVISIVNSDYLFEKNWLSVDNNFIQNKNLKSGDIAKLYLKDIDVEIYDYFWSKKDYFHCFKKAGFSSIEFYEPLGNKNDPYEWLDELKYPPYSIFICKA